LGQKSNEKSHENFIFLEKNLPLYFQRILEVADFARQHWQDDSHQQTFNDTAQVILQCRKSLRENGYQAVGQKLSAIPKCIPRFQLE
jgi:hypothetical protein